jgi:hypothetical protein
VNGVPNIADLAAKAAKEPGVLDVETVDIVINGQVMKATPMFALLKGIEAMNGYLKSIDATLKEIRDAEEPHA